MDEVEGKKFNVADIMGAFSQSSGGGDEEILKIASEYALQVGPRQIQTIMRLKMFALTYAKINENLTFVIESFIQEYLKVKHFHESGMFIRGVIGDLSLKKIIPPDAIRMNVMKGQ